MNKLILFLLGLLLGIVVTVLIQKQTQSEPKTLSSSAMRLNIGATGYTGSTGPSGPVEPEKPEEPVGPVGPEELIYPINFDEQTCPNYSGEPSVYPSDYKFEFKGEEEFGGYDQILF